MISKTFDEIRNTGALPTPSGVGLRVLSIMGEEEWSIEELIETVQADPALTGRLIRVANSSSTQVIGSAREAAMRLGARAIGDIALGFSLVAGNRSGSCRTFDYDGYWADALARAVAARGLSAQMQSADPTQAFTCALLTRIGELALASVHPRAYAKLQKRLVKDPEADVLALEEEYFHIEHHEIAMAMLGEWGMPTSSCEGVGFYAYADGLERACDPRSVALIKVLRFASSVAKCFGATADDRVRRWREMDGVREATGLDTEGFGRFWESLAAEWKEWGEVLGVPTSVIPSADEMMERSSALEEARHSEPAIPAASEIEEETNREAGSGQHAAERERRILIAEPNEAALEVLANALRVQGLEVATSATSREALATALESSPHLVLAAWDLGDGHGLELCKALRRYEGGRNVYFLILLPDEDGDRIVQSFEAGVDDAITTPFQLRILMARVQAGVRIVALQQEVNRERKTQREQMGELALLTRRLHEAALTDALTGVPNRRHGMMRLDEGWSTWQRNHTPISLVAMDIDHFKNVNDNYGHDTGDVVLRRTCEAITQTCRGGDVLVRMGGEEFLLICPETPLLKALGCAERLRVAVEGNRVKHGRFNGCVTLSLGVATFDEHVESVEHALKLADEAVYRAKSSGRNCVREATSKSKD